MLTGSVVYLTGCSNSQNGSDDNTSTNTSTEYAHADKIDNGTILQCFSWDFNTIKKDLWLTLRLQDIRRCRLRLLMLALRARTAECNFTVMANGTIIISPPILKSVTINSDRDEFKAMCDEAEKYGIKVIVDVIANHTTPTTSAVSQDLIDAGGGSLDTLYHKETMRMTSLDFSNRLGTTYKMGGLPDINTERTSFQDYFIEYLNDCVACGADGFRYDTAKHIGLPDDLRKMTALQITSGRE